MNPQFQTPPGSLLSLRNLDHLEIPESFERPENLENTQNPDRLEGPRNLESLENPENLDTLPSQCK